MAVELAPQAARILIPLIIKVPHTIVPQLCHECAYFCGLDCLHL